MLSRFVISCQSRGDVFCRLVIVFPVHSYPPPSFFIALTLVNWQYYPGALSQSLSLFISFFLSLSFVQGIVRVHGVNRLKVDRTHLSTLVVSYNLNSFSIIYS